jgi:hypothetical protein
VIGEVIRCKTKNNVPKLVILFSIIKINYLRNNRLFKKNLPQSKGNRMTKLGRLFFVLHLITITNLNDSVKKISKIDPITVYLLEVFAVYNITDEFGFGYSIIDTKDQIWGYEDELLQKICDFCFNF